MDADFLLIHKMKNGDEEAIEVFVKKYYSTIRNYCRLHTYTDCDAEDITQATFEHFFRSFRSYHHLFNSSMQADRRSVLERALSVLIDLTASK